LYYILSNVGGAFGLILRHKIDEIDQIESCLTLDEAFNLYLSWLPEELVEKLTSQAQKDLVKSTFKVGSDVDENAYHMVCSQYRRSRILTIARAWIKNPHSKESLKRNDMREDTITTIHWRD
jgi:4-aminobutyrate aminotransferase-like enzyme